MSGSKAERVRRKKEQRKAAQVGRPAYVSQGKKKQNDQHVAALQAEIQRLTAQTPHGLRRIKASFPEVADLLDYCWWLIDMVDPTAGRSMGPIARGVIKAEYPDDAARRVAWYMKHRRWLKAELEGIVRQLRDRLDPTEYDRYRLPKPQCWRRSCRLYGRHQKPENQVCEGCGEPFSQKKKGD